MKKELRALLRKNALQLETSARDMRAIYTIMFSNNSGVLCEENDGFRIKKYTYGQLHSRIEGAAAALRERLGAEDRYVALEMENCVDWIVAFWAILRSGNKPYLVNMRYPQGLTQGILQQLQVGWAVSKGPGKLELSYIDVDELNSEARLPEDCFADELAFSSSATSMNEVICFYTGKQISAQILNFRQIVKEEPRIAKHYQGSLKQLAFLPFYHVFGLFAVYFWFTFFGRTLVFLRDYSADTILKTCRRHQVTHIFAVPMLWHTVEQQVWATAKKQNQEQKLHRGIRLMTALQNLLPGIGPEIAKVAMKQVTGKLFGPSVMFCINGGSYLRDSAMELLNGIGYSMHNGYGMSEIGITSVELRHCPKHRNLNSVGKPFAAVEYRLDRQGILQVRGDTLCSKKLVNGEAVTMEGWFSTGDRMECRKGHYSILGRQGDVVIGENGENIHPDTVEKAFRLPGSKMLSILGLPGKQGQELSLVVQVEPYITDGKLQSLRTAAYAINDTFPSAMAVKRFYFTTDPLCAATAVKVSRTQLAHQIQQGQVRLTPFAEMQSTTGKDGASPLLEPVRRIIAQVLELPVEQVQPTSHIFHDLGADSIRYFSILTALAEEFSIAQYDKNDTFRYTPEEICEYIERNL